MTKSKAVLAAIILAALPARCVEPSKPKSFWTKGTIAVVSVSAVVMAADIVTTRQAIARGGHESNPLMQNQNAAIALKVAGVAGITGIAWMLHKSGHPTAARVVLWTGSIPSGLAAAHNSRVR